MNAKMGVHVLLSSDTSRYPLSHNTVSHLFVNISAVLLQALTDSSQFFHKLMAVEFAQLANTSFQLKELSAQCTSACLHTKRHLAFSRTEEIHVATQQSICWDTQVTNRLEAKQAKHLLSSY